MGSLIDRRKKKDRGSDPSLLSSARNYLDALLYANNGSLVRTGIQRYQIHQNFRPPASFMQTTAKHAKKLSVFYAKFSLRNHRLATILLGRLPTNNTLHLYVEGYPKHKSNIGKYEFQYPTEHHKSQSQTTARCYASLPR